MFQRVREVNLDANATTPASDAVRRVMTEVLAKQPGNPSSIHRAGRDAALVVEAARGKVARAINASPSEIVFNSGASEGNNTVLQALAAMARAGTLPSAGSSAPGDSPRDSPHDAARDSPRRNRLLTSPAEHSSVRAVADVLATQGIVVDWLPVDGHGRVDPAALAARLDERVFLVSVMLANNELGTINPVAELARLAHGAGALFHADCVQACGKIPVDVRELDVDYATFSAHKLYGPKGIGVLYVHSRAPRPVLLHGGHQEDGARAGTEAVHDIAGCGEAFASVPALLDKAPGIARRRDCLRERLSALKPDLVENSPRDAVVCNTLNLRFPGLDNADALAFLDANGIAVSAGSACAARGGSASPVLRAIGLDDAEAGESLRFSLAADTGDKDIEYVVSRFADYLGGAAAAVSRVSPATVDASYLADERHYILDVRLGIERRLMRGMPGSHEIPFPGFARYLDSVPRDRRVLVVCSSGIDASLVARALVARGHRNVGVLVGGLWAWRALHPGGADRR